jgi:DNA topoisomerase VI subunit A
MFCLVDNDPYGLCIYGVYKHGGGQNTSVIERERLALPGLRFLGIENGDFNGRGGGLMELTGRDRRRCEGMMRKDWVLGDREVLYVSLCGGWGD